LCLLQRLIRRKFRPAQKSTIEGIATDRNGRPLKNAEVRLQQETTKSPAITVRTDAKGHFAAADLPAGAYAVTVVINKNVTWSGTHVKAANGKTVRLNARPDNPAVALSSTPKKRAVWVPDRTGSRLGGHWEDEPYRGPGGDDVDSMGAEQLRRMQSIQAPPPSSGGR
jgi:Carboxypeptidase regulatory-like domain